jgi:arylsulfatase A-like enzyme
MRVPFIAAWAKPNPDNPHQKGLPITRGAIQSQPAAVYDLFPTILSLLKLDPPGTHIIDGARLDGLLTGERDSSREEVFLMHYPHAPHRSDYFTCFRKGDWKVIYHYYPSEASEGSHYQLYNLANDPFEQNNLSSSNPEQLQAMMKELIARLEKQNAQYPREQDGKTPRKPAVPERE